MSYSKFYLVLISFLTNFCFSQEDNSNLNSIAIGKSIEVSKFDIFHSFTGIMSFDNAFKIMPSLGVGIQKSYMLQRLYPRFSLGFGFDMFKNKTNFNFGPELRLAISAYKLNDNERLSYTDGVVGYFLYYGNKWKFVHQLSAGRGVEKRVDMDLNTTYWSFNLVFGVAYAL